MKKFICALTSASVILSCVPVFASSGIVTATDKVAAAKLELANEFKDLFVNDGETAAMTDEELAAKLAHMDELQATISSEIVTAAAEVAAAKLELANELIDLFVNDGETTAMTDEELAAKLAHMDELQAIILN